MDMQRLQRNRQQFPPEELARYAGKYVAWNPEGTHILASNEDELQLAYSVRAAGYDTAEVLIAFVPAEDNVVLGGGMDTINPKRHSAEEFSVAWRRICAELRGGLQNITDEEIHEEIDRYRATVPRRV